MAPLNLSTLKPFFARAERFELPSTVLETAILPLNYARIKLLDVSYQLLAKKTVSLES
jgi:hypothetical protein